MPKKANSRIEQKILTLWSIVDEERKLISYKQIIDTLKSDGVSERTVDRHLLMLVQNEKLEKIKKGYNKPFFRPCKEFWENLVKSNQQFLIAEESMRRVGAYVIEVLNKSIAEAKPVTKEMEAHVWDEISSRLPQNEKEDSSPAFAEAMDFVLKEKKLTDKERKELYILVDSLIKGSLLQGLTDPTVFARLVSENELPYDMQENIWNLVKEFMAIWVFLYKHPWGVPELENYLKKIIP